MMKAALRLFPQMIAPTVLFLASGMLWGDEKAPAAAPAAKRGWCQSIYRAYRETREQGLSRILMRDPSPEDPRRPMLGLFTEHQPELRPTWREAPIGNTLGFIPRKINDAIQLLPRTISRRLSQDGRAYDFTPGSVVSGVLDASVSKVARWKTGAPKLASGLVHFGTNIGVYSLVGYKYHDWMIDEADFRMLDLSGVLDQLGPELDERIQSDFRFREIRAERESGSLNTQRARAKAYYRTLEFQDYYDLLSREDPQGSEASRRDQILNEPLFADLYSLIRESDWKPYLAGPLPPGAQGKIQPKDLNQPLSADQAKELVAVRNELYITLGMIPEWIKKRGDAKALDEMFQEPSLRAILKNLDSDPFIQKLFNLQRQGKIQTAALIDLIGEDTYWRTRYAEWDLLKVVPVKKGQSGPIPVPFEAWREEALRRIDSGR